jgi:hypothetical protein
MSRVFSFFLSTIYLPQKDFKLFTRNRIYIITLMEFKLEIKATRRRMRQTFLCGTGNGHGYA